MSGRGRHAVVLETARRIQTLILQIQTARLQTAGCGQTVIPLQYRLAFTDGHQLFVCRKSQQLAESPDAAVVQWIQTRRPALLKIRQSTRQRDPVPVIADVQQ